jgi:regulator of protease activity HflC (stomatin/prohibitin superfamily)
MFEWLREIFAALHEHLIPFIVVYDYERAGVFRLGKYHRTLDPGFHWRWPLIETAFSEHIVVTTLALEPQTITTKDDKTVVVGGIVRYRIADVKTFLCEVSNQHDVLRDTSMGAVIKQVRQVDLRTLLDEPPENRIASDIRRQVKPFGIDIDSFTFTDCGPIKTLRIITHTYAPPSHYD